MRWKNWIRQQTDFHTINKKIFLLSKLIAIVIILALFISNRFKLNSVFSIILLIAFLAFFMILLELIMYKIVSEPVQSLEKSAKKMAKLDFSEYCNIDTKDEYGSLAKNLNIMADNLQDTLNKLENANIKLKNDIEREKDLLLERKILIDNLSHEMKTPLGIINAYAEGIKDTKDENKKLKYLDNIIDSTKEMSELINWLLDLSSLESGIAVLNYEKIDFIEMVETVAGRLLMDLPYKNFILKYELPENKVFISTDVKRMEQVLNNLILNAKNYVIDNGIIDIRIKEEDNFVKFTIYNDCNKISEDELEKIWDKFYIRNIEESGSGLGLAIVSQILDIQGIDYGVNAVKNGIEFYINIEKVS